MNMTVRVHTFGAVGGKTYPQGTYKVAGEYSLAVTAAGKKTLVVNPLCDAGLLVARGWTIAKPPRNGSSYFYLTAPKNEYTKRPEIDINIPSPQAIRELAETLHQQNLDNRGILDGWPYSFRAYKQEERTTKLMTRTGTRFDTRMVTDPAWFDIGQSLTWRVSAIWDNEDAPPRWCGHQPTIFLILATY